eukprot:scaffold843_cov255-Pinguiococcus_pyrenoidosus.AAC.1
MHVAFCCAPPVCSDAGVLVELHFLSQVRGESLVLSGRSGRSGTEVAFGASYPRFRACRPFMFNSAESAA